MRTHRLVTGLVVFAALLLASLVTSATAQSARDSVLVDIVPDLYSRRTPEGNGFCGAQVLALRPDVLQDADLSTTTATNASGDAFREAILDTRE